MRVRRCKVLYLEPREEVAFDLQDLLAGGDGVARQRRWFALAPHSRGQVPVDAAARDVLGGLSPERWVEEEMLSPAQREALPALVEAGLVVCDEPAHAAMLARDEALRAAHWHPLAATAHALTRWNGVDTTEAMRNTGTQTAPELRQVLGPPPPEAIVPPRAGAPLPLPVPEATGFDALLRRRATCRNFDRGRPLPMEELSRLLHRVFAAQGTVRVTGDTVFLKKNSPSGGGLHPVEAYLLVQQVEGLDAGLYHYDPLAHALRPLPAPPGSLDGFALQAVAGQTWFAQAHVLAILAPRYARNFWKYRQHAKAHRAVVLEAGHLSQTLYLAATEAGLAAYVTCAINEDCLDEALGLDPVNEGVLAVCGFGWRGQVMETMELDPLGAAWQVPPPPN
ncbi:SagB-type dehydrogenase domain [Pseudoxanthomonas suwonensis 11-1]|uniref:SagB-type dehydrogenase domain n=1 Tax=Pseudoxanthomonas suwonensis (strain 11-1) TaxID=743721 RepID=E6WPQ0_PSEUU|nr:putative peptide maturation dehydrogenase [Pseudoxanthomonas suwonensis]ADV26005.1 SagB-type dehydrogenase domain [Pseudoxanthomonas suwonensis 11-1]